MFSCWCEVKLYHALTRALWARAPPPRGRDRFAARRCVTRGNLFTSNRPGLNIISVLRGWSVWSSRHYSSYSKRPILRKCTESGVTCEEDHDTHIQGIISFPSPRTAAYCFFCFIVVVKVGFCSFLKSLRVLISARLRHDTEHCPSVDSNKRGSCFMYKDETHGHSMMCINIIWGKPGVLCLGLLRSENQCLRGSER